METETILSLKESYIAVETKHNGAHSQKNISYADMEKMFETKGRHSSAYLPGEYGLQRFDIKGNREIYLYTEPARKAVTKYYINGDKTVKNDFMVPALAWFIVLDKNSSGYKYVEAQVFAMKTPVFTGKETLFRMPFSNVYRNNQICWGRNVVNIPTLKAIQGLSTLFFASSFNGDLDDRRFQYFDRTFTKGQADRTVHLQMEVGEMLKKGLSEQDVLTFVESKLINCGEDEQQRTVDNIYSSLLSSYM